VVIRLIVMHDRGRDHLGVLRRLATGPQSMLVQHHILPMLQELTYGDMIFGVFPRIAVSMDRSICSWPKNSVEDILDMITQALDVRRSSV
jgi:hypothetical protein